MTLTFQVRENKHPSI